MAADNRAAVLQYVIEHPSCKTGDVVEGTGVAITAVKRHLAKLVDEKVLERALEQERSSAGRAAYLYRASGSSTSRAKAIATPPPLDVPPPAQPHAPPVSPRVRKLEQEARPARELDDEEAELSDREEKILRLLADDALTARQLAQVLVVNVHELGVDLRHLVALERIGSRGDGSFELLERAAVEA